MDQTHPQVQFSNSESFQHSTSYKSQDKDDNIPSVLPQSYSAQPDNNIHSNQLYDDDNLVQPISILDYQLPLQTPLRTSNHENVNHMNQNIQYSTDPATLIQLPLHLKNFFYQPPNDPFNYHIECEKITVQLLNAQIQLKDFEYVFYYQQQFNDKQIYKVSCEFVSPSLINCCLNKNYYGIEIEQNMGKEQLSFTSYQKENLRLYLTQYLSHHLLD